MTIATIQKTIAQRRASTLAEHYYTSDRIFERESDRIFYKHWICVGRSEQIPETGAYFLAEVGEESLIILRDTEGTARAFFNVCRHRGTPLCSELQGHFVDAIHCPQHGWSYTLEGQLCTARTVHSAEMAAAQECALYSCALYEWEGFLWVNLAPNPAPFAQTFAPLLNRFAPWRMLSLRSLHQSSYDVPANWKLIFQNYSERYHTPFAHAQLSRRAAARSGEYELKQGAFLGGYMTHHRPGDQLQRVYYYLLFPTMLLSLHANYVVVHRLHPQSVDRTRVICDWLADPSVGDRPSFDLHEAIEQWDAANRQSWQVCGLMQQEIEPSSPPAPRAAAVTGLLSAFDQEYLRIMGKQQR